MLLCPALDAAPRAQVDACVRIFIRLQRFIHYDRTSLLKRGAPALHRRTPAKTSESELAASPKVNVASVRMPGLIRFAEWTRIMLPYLSGSEHGGDCTPAPAKNHIAEDE